MDYGRKLENHFPHIHLGNSGKSLELEGIADNDLDEPYKFLFKERNLYTLKNHQEYPEKNDRPMRQYLQSDRMDEDRSFQ